MRRLVIYKDGRHWYGAAEYTLGRWPFKKVQHAPVTHADTPEQVFAWLRQRYPDRHIAFDPEVTQRYNGK